VERPLEADEFEALWGLTEGRRVTKVRSVVPLGEYRAEVDAFEGALDGLAIAEVEFPSPEAADAFEPPEWFGAEVTGRPEWGNAALAVHGRPDGG
jgi:adenylate cyclase